MKTLISFKNGFFKQKERAHDNKEYALKFLSDSLDNRELRDEILQILTIHTDSSIQLIISLAK